jgi:hypothetical protein
VNFIGITIFPVVFQMAGATIIAVMDFLSLFRGTAAPLFALAGFIFFNFL